MIQQIGRLVAERVEELGVTVGPGVSVDVLQHGDARARAAEPRGAQELLEVLQIRDLRRFGSSQRGSNNAGADGTKKTSSGNHVFSLWFAAD